MEQDKEAEHLTRRFTKNNAILRVLVIVLLVSVLAGVGTGYYLASTKTGNQMANSLPLQNDTPKSAAEDKQICKDFAEGKVTKKPAPKDSGTYEEGTHMLVRDGAVPVALTSSVVDMTLYENKKVKVCGETQKAIKEGWLMDVVKVEEIK